MLHTMYYEEKCRKVEGFGAPDVELKEAEIKVAHQLIEALADEWIPRSTKDTFQENLKKLIEAKLEGGEVAAVEKPKKLAPVVDLMAALKQSLAQMEGRRSLRYGKIGDARSGCGWRQITPSSVRKTSKFLSNITAYHIPFAAHPTWALRRDPRVRKSRA